MSKANKESDEEQKYKARKLKQRKMIKWTLVGVLFFYVVFAVMPFIAAASIPEFTPNIIGDSFGVANAFFSALALAGVIIAIYLQMDELAAQMDEMKLQRQEMIEMQRVQLLPLRLKMLEEYGDSQAHNFEIEAYEQWKTEMDIIEEFIGLQVNEYLSQNSVLKFEECLSRLEKLSSRILIEIDSLIEIIVQCPIGKKDDKDKITDKVTANIHRMKRYLDAYSNLANLSTPERESLHEFRSYIKTFLTIFSANICFQKEAKESVTRSLFKSLQPVFLHLMTSNTMPGELKKLIEKSHSSLTAAFPPQEIDESSSKSPTDV